jgi:micrococcal nuclease
MYTYKAKTVRIVDGDTVDAMVDLGFKTFKKVRIRLYGFNAPESRTRDLEEKKRGLAAKARLIELLDSIDNEFTLISHGVGKFGRCLGEIMLNDHSSAQNQLIKEGHGVKYDGGKR